MPRGTYDPQRAQRLAVAALEVVSERGVEGLTHRAVAAAAGVPLGSTTYHFKTLDDLLEAAMRVAKAKTDDEFALLSARIGADGDLVGALAAYLFRTIAEHVGRTIVEFELYLAAMRRPALRELSMAWGEAMPAMLAQHCSRPVAEAVAITVDGILLKSVAQGYPLDEAETRAHLAHSFALEMPTAPRRKPQAPSLR